MNNFQTHCAVFVVDSGDHTHWKASGSQDFLPLFPHLPWSTWIHPYSSLASFPEQWLGLGQSHSDGEWEKGWDGPSAQPSPESRARLINIAHTDKQEAQLSGKLNIQQSGNYRLPITFEVQHTSRSKCNLMVLVSYYLNKMKAVFSFELL